MEFNWKEGCIISTVLTQFLSEKSCEKYSGNVCIGLEKLGKKAHAIETNEHVLIVSIDHINFINYKMNISALLNWINLVTWNGSQKIKWQMEMGMGMRMQQK